MKKGDKIRFTGEEWEYAATTKGKEYIIEAIDEVMAMYRGDNDRNYYWYHKSYPNDFTLVQAEQDDALVEFDPNMLQEGDIIKFMGVPEGKFIRYRDTTIGKEYEIIEVFTEYDEIIVRYIDNAGDTVRWCPQKYEEMYHFKVMTEQRLYKDDVLATAPTLQDLKTTLDLALLVNDIQWAQDLYQQIQQMEGEHA